MQTRTAEGTSTSIAAPGTTREWTWTLALRDAPINHPDLAPLYRTWKRLQRDGGLPCASQFSFDDLAPWLGRVCVARARAGDYEIELIGCSLTNEDGQEISRVKLSDSKLGPVGVNAREMLETVTGMGVIALPCGSVECAGAPVGWHGIALPLAESAALICFFVLD